MTDISTENMCCNNSSDNVNEESTIKIIFGWNKFNTRAWIVLFISFIIWAVTFFTMYPTAKDNSMKNETATDSGHHHRHE